MREPTFLILAALAPRSLHGYGIIQAVEEMSAGRITLRAGTLYAALDRLVDEGLLANDRDEVVDGRTRHYYRITDEGAAALRHETQLWQANVTAATRQLGLRPLGGRS
jgi:PadR family transcriptional regulator, regulatory protein PadR